MTVDSTLRKYTQDFSRTDWKKRIQNPRWAEDAKFDKKRENWWGSALGSRFTEKPSRKRNWLTRQLDEAASIFHGRDKKGRPNIPGVRGKMIR